MAKLVFKGLQVIANITLDDHCLTPVTPTNNEHREWIFDVADILNKADKDSFLNVSFTSSVLYGKHQLDIYNTSHKPDAPAYLDELEYRNMFRTEQSSFGWDWAPAFAPQGIFRDVFIEYVTKRSQEFTTAVMIREIVSHVLSLSLNHTVDLPLTNNNNSFLINVDIFVEVYSQGASFDLVPITIVANSTTLNIKDVKSKVMNMKPNSAEVMFNMDLYVNNVPLWWPRGYGEPTLHNITFMAYANEECLIAQTDITTGVCSTELITAGDPLMFNGRHKALPNELIEQGDSISPRPAMFLRINGIPIYSQGANLIPFRSFSGRVNDTFILDILNSSAAANMNLIRIWGGGLFVQEFFYEMCDRMGLMVWQKMMLACAEYPIDVPFLQNVREEVKYQLRRLGKFPSIVIWSGNNEDGDYDQGPKSSYAILEYDTVLDQVIREDASRPIWPASPSKGFKYGVTKSGLPAGTREHPALFKVGGNSGDTHYYDYSQCPNVDMFPKTNIGSGYGFQSLSLFDVIKSVSKKEDWFFSSKLMDFRQYLRNGRSILQNLIIQNFRAPFNFSSTDINVFKRIIYLSQLQQTYCISEESRYYKRGRNMMYRTMGFLYWQLNQIWQTPSWAFLEFGGEWKVLPYAMREVYASLMLSGYFDNKTKTYIAHIASDLIQPYKGAKGIVEAIFFNGTSNKQKRILIDNITIPEVPPLSGIFFWNMTSKDFFSKFGHFCPTTGDCFLQLSIFDPTGKKRLAEPYPLWLSVSLKNNNLDVNSTVIAKVINATKTTATVSISLKDSTSGSAIYTVIHISFRGIFSRNMFPVLLDEPFVIQFNTTTRLDGKQEEIPSIEDFQKSLTVEWLNNQW